MVNAFGEVGCPRGALAEEDSRRWEEKAPRNLAAMELGSVCEKSPPTLEHGGKYKSVVDCVNGKARRREIQRGHENGSNNDVGVVESGKGDDDGKNQRLYQRT